MRHQFNAPVNSERHAAERDEDLALITLVWNRRKVIAAIMVTAAVAIAVFAAAMYVWLPVERLATLQFRMLFEGGDRSQYPNGTPFSGADVIATPVLDEVFTANELRTYGSFDDFRNALFVVESNPAIQFLAQEYQARLADPKLTPIERSRIEEEFRNRREGLKVSYTLSFRRSERFKQLPSELISKVLGDILSVWAKQATERRGILKHNVPVLSRNILSRTSLETEEYVVIVDVLRSHVLRIIQNVDLLATLPGAAVMRVGNDRISLAEVRANLEHLYQFKVQPLIGAVRSSGVSKDPEFALLYLESRLAQNRLETQEANGKLRTLQNSLLQSAPDHRQAVPTATAAEQRPANPAGTALGVTALIPQFGESFLDRLVEMSTQNNDARFRQDLIHRSIDEGVKGVTLEKDSAYYQDLLDSLRVSLRQPPTGAQANRQRIAEIVKTRAAETLNDLLISLDQINAIYTELSTRNLVANTLLYSITSPFTIRSSTTLDLRRMAVFGLIATVVSGIATVVFLAYSPLRRKMLATPVIAAVEAMPVVVDTPKRSASTETAGDRAVAR